MPGLEGDLEEWQTQEVNVIPDSSTFSCTYQYSLFSSCEMTDSHTLDFISLMNCRNNFLTVLSPSLYCMESLSSTRPLNVSI